MPPSRPLLPPSDGLRLLFLNPPDLRGGLWMKEVGRCGRKAVGGEIWPQTGLACLAAVAEQAGMQCRIFDGMAQPLPPDELDSRIRSWKPDLILANSATPTLRNDGVILERLARSTGALCGFTGPHVSALPRETLQETGADFGLVNEAEETTADFARAVRDLAGAAGAGVATQSVRTRLEGIRGLVWRQPSAVPAAGGPLRVRLGYGAALATPGPVAALPDELVLNPDRALVQNLDALPYPARHLLPNQAYRMPFFGDHPFATLIPSRGCPWPCTFCRAGQVWGRGIRVRSVSNILGEITALQRDAGIHHLAFMTDSLTLNRKWARDLFLGLAALDPPVEWVCNSRVDMVEADLLALMKQAGCRMISYGLESGVQSLLDGTRKGITLEQSARAIRLTRAAGIPSMAYFILGLPGETRETVLETLAFARRLEPDYVNFHVATPFPGTELYEQAVAKGWLTSRNWDDYEEEGSAVLQAGALTPAELRDWQARAMRGFYLRPRRLLRECLSLRTRADWKARLRAGLHMLGTLRPGTKAR